MAESEGKVKVEISDKLFCEFAIHNLTIKTKESEHEQIRQFDKVRFDEIDTFWHLTETSKLRT